MNERMPIGARLTLLSRATAELASVDTKEAVFDCLARTLMELEPDVIVVLSDVEDKKITIRSLEGIDVRMRKVMEILGQDPVGMTFDLIFFDEPGYTEGEVLLELEGGLYDVAGGQFPRAASAAVEKLLGFTTMFSGALHWGGTMRGNATVALRGKTELDSPDVVRVLLRMASSALDRLEVLEDLRDSEHQYRSSLEFLDDMIHVVDRDMRIQVANKALCDMCDQLGRELEPVGAMLADVCPFWSERIIDEYQRVFEKGELLETDEELELGGQRFFVEARKIPIIEDGTVVRVMTVMHDTTARERALEALRQSEETNRALINGFSDVAFMTDDAGRIIVCNEALASIFGRSTSELAGTCIFDLLPEEVASTRRRMHEEVVASASAEVTRFEDSFRGMTFENAVYPILGEGESRFAIFVRDVTEQRQMEQELLRAQKVESMGVLAGGIAHDFNNLLSAILGNISLAKMSLEGQDEVLELLDESEAACHRASGLTRQLLTFSRGGEPITKRTSIETLVMESAGFALRGSNVKVEFDVDDELWSVQVDRGQIGQAVSNLVINADQAMPRGGVLRIAVRNKLFEEPNPLGMPPGGYVEIAIRDQGTGISQENLPLVFDPYFTTKQRGSGLGLSSAYSIVRRHGGVLTVESEEGEGATFHIYLRASREVPERPSIEPGLVRKGSGRILVMDDEDAVRMVTGRMLEKLGYEPAFAKDGAEALVAYAEALEKGRRFDAVIMDLTIPGGMGGAEAISKLLELDPDARAIVSSGYSNDPVMADHRKHGFRGVVAKPVRMDALSEVIEGALSGQTPDGV